MNEDRFSHRMNRTGVPIQVNDGVMGGRVAIGSVPIGAKQEVKVGSKSRTFTNQYLL